MKIIRLFGGLGNQMFQYAFGQVIQGDVAYDVSWFNEIKGNQNVTQRSYELGFFQCSPWILSSEELLMIINSANQLGGKDAYQFVTGIPANIYNPELLKIENAIFMGYFQCYQYYDKIRPQLLSEFKPIQKIPQKNKEILDLIQNTNSVSVHIRRGDYIKFQHRHGLCGLEYYQKAIDFIASKIPSPHFFFFSDDIK